MALGYDDKKKSKYFPNETPEEKAAREIHESAVRIGESVDRSIELIDEDIKRIRQSRKKLAELTLD